MLKKIKSFTDFVNEAVSVDKIDLPSYEESTVEYMPYSSEIKENTIPFQKKLVSICKSLEINPKWLMVMIHDLSKFNAKQRDGVTKATGLIKFFPWSVNSFLDTNTGNYIKVKDIATMSNLDQLDLINAYYESWIDKLDIKKPLSPGDFAAITFYPSVIKKDWEWNFPDEVTRVNNEFFARFSGVGEKNKKAYYDYIEKILRDPKETQANNIFGDLTGAMFDPYTFNTKEALEKYTAIVEGTQEAEEGDDEEDIKQLKNDTNINYETNA